MTTKVHVGAATYKKIYDLMYDIASPRAPKLPSNTKQRAVDILADLNREDAESEKTFRVNDVDQSKG